MKDILEKISIIMGELVVYAPDIKGVSDLTLYDTYCDFIITFKNGSHDVVSINYSELVKLHDYKLEQYIVSLFIKNGK